MYIPEFITCKTKYVMDWCTAVEVGEKVRVRGYNSTTAQLFIRGNTATWVPISDIKKFFEGWTE